MSRMEVIVNEKQDDRFELAAWMGRRQAFGMMASRCSAADVECLRAIRERRLYKSLSASWAEFCDKYVGFSKAYADRLIKHLEEFGPNYFHISQMVRISAEDYRIIAGSVHEDGIEFRGRKIPIDWEHSQEVVEAVKTLRKAAEGKEETENAGGRPGQDGAQEPVTLQERMELMRAQVDRFIAEYSRIGKQPLDRGERARLEALIDESSKRLAVLHYMSPLAT